MEPKVAVVIPSYSDSILHGEWAAKTALTWKPLCDDLIISDDAGYYEALHQVADLYLLHEQLWCADNMNLGWKVALARGADFVAIMDMDAHWVSGSLRDACIPGKVTVPSIVQHPDTVNIGPMFIVPKEIAAERGFLSNGDGNWKTAWFDADYHQRVVDIITQVPELKVFHEGGSVTGVHPYWPPVEVQQEEQNPKREVDPERHKHRLSEVRYNELHGTVQGLDSSA